MKNLIYLVLVLSSLTAYGQIIQNVNKTSGTVPKPITQIDSIRFNAVTNQMEIIQTNGNAENHVISDIINVTFSGQLNGTLTTIDCAGATTTGTLTSGTAANGVSTAISYTGGNAGTYSAQNVASTGVTGLTATLAAGTLANGNGSVTYTITGTPASVGTATFAITLGGQSCSFTVNVSAPAAALTTIDCAGATTTGTLTSGTAANGVSTAISYTGGNAGTYSAQNVTSTGVTGLTATLAAGTLANGNGSVTYTITGTPASAGTATFAITLGGQSCSFTINILAHPQYSANSVFCAAGATAIVDVTNPTTGLTWMDRNLGASQVATSSTDQNAYGDLYQWGRRADGHQCRISPTTATLSSVDQPAHGNFIVALNAPNDWRSPQNTNLWQGVNGVNNPCPSGYRLPTETELNNERLSWFSNGGGGAFASPLKWTLAGFRSCSDGSLLNVGLYGYYSSSTVSGTTSLSLSFYSNSSDMLVFYRANGFSVRCLSSPSVVLTTIDCVGASTTGTLTSGSAANGVSTAISYTGGNAGTYGAQSVASTGVTGLTASLAAGTLANGNGSVTYTITGTPASAGTASFAITLGGQSCSFTINVSSPAAVLATINCAGATTTGTLTSGTAANGVSTAISYTGGNAGTYSAQNVASTGVTGLTATLAAGTLANGAGSVTYTITGTPASAGTASFAITVGGQSCSFTVNVAAAQPQYPANTVNCNGVVTVVNDVTNPTTGLTWMDRNLGASQVATSSTDQNAYGDLYQWGRRADGHQCRTSPTTAILSSVDQPAHGNFILAPNAPYDWRSPQNTNLWQGVNGVNNPCPSGYRIPTETELNNECLSWGSNNGSGAFAAPLKWTLAGDRFLSNGTLGNVGTDGYYWSITVSGTYSRALVFNSSSTAIVSTGRAFGISARCIKVYAATLGALNCAGATATGSLTSGTAANGVSTAISYTGGNAGTYSAQNVASTGVTGLTATLAAGTLANGAGSVTYTITGTPASAGTASFTITVGGQSCSFTVSVAAAAVLTTINCASATTTGTLTSGTAANNVSSSVPYTGGNGGFHAAQNVASTGVTGLTATLAAGTLANGAGSVTYTITGAPASSGTASFAITLGGQSCSFTVSVMAIGQYPAGTVHCAGATIVVNVTNPTTGKIWMDRNLGASQVATSSTDQNAYGDLYQWGRRADGHQCRTSPTTATLSSVDQPAHGNFITINSGYFDWRSPQNDNLWQGVNGVNNPCPSGYRLPTETELNNERLSWGSNNGAGAFAAPLKWTLAGYRNNSNGSLTTVGTSGRYWSSTVFGSSVNYLNFSSNDAFVYHFIRAYGLTVRCLKH